MNIRRTFKNLVLTGALSASALADTAPTGSVDDRLRRLEEEVGQLRDENRLLRKELGSGAARPVQLAVPAIKPAGHEQQLAIGGFLQVEGDFLDKGDSRFSTGNDRIFLRRARLALTGRFSKELDFKMDVEMAGSLGESSGFRGQMMDGFLNWTPAPFAGVRIGQFKTPYGFEQLCSDTALPVIERSLSNDRLTLSRQIGVQVFGDLWAKRVAYSTGVFNGSGTNTNANDNGAFLWAGRISGVPLKMQLGGRDVTWSVGVNSFATKDSVLTGQSPDFGFTGNSFTGQRTGLGLDTQFHVGSLALWAEYLSTRFKPASKVPSGVFSAAGWQAQAAYTFVPKYWQGVARFESFDPNTSRAGNSTDTYILGANYLFGGEDVKLMVDYYLFNAAGQPDQRQKILVRLQTIF